MEDPWPQTVTAVITAIAGAGTAIVGAWTVMEARRFRETQTSPHVAVYLERNKRYTSSVDLVIRNLGAAPAYLVKFDIRDSSVPFGIIQEEDIYILRNGINFFAPGQLFRYSLNTYDKLPKDEFTIDVCYFAKGESDHTSCRRESFTLRPLELGGFGEWNNREREALIATKKGMDSLRRTMDALAHGRITLTVQPTIPPPDPDPTPMTAREFRDALASIPEPAGHPIGPNTTETEPS